MLAVFLVGTVWAVVQIRERNAIPSSAPTGSAVRVTVKPEQVLVERSESGQHLNFDFLLENLTDQRLVLTGVELFVFDDEQRLVRRDFINRFSRSSLAMSPDLAVPAGQSILVFNPFHSFAASMPVTMLRFEFAFSSSNGTVRHSSVADVTPVIYETKTALVLPVRGRVLVWDGHDYASHHRRFDYSLPVFRARGLSMNFQRYGYDFVLVDEQGRMHRGAPKHPDDWYAGRPDANEDYFAFGQPVYAAGAGRVVGMHDGEDDNRRVDPSAYARRETAGGGNYVVIDHLNGEFSWFGHLKKGSVKVVVGQSVQQGDVLGEVGASGESLFPHLHYELRTGPGIKAEGLPSYFDGFRRVGSQRPSVKGQLDSGDIVENR